MSNSPINDDDKLMAYQDVGKGRTRAYPISWRALKGAILALVPTVQGPKGDPGAKGDPGKDGLAGRDGQNGTNGKDGAAGKSAYDLASGSGFTGTLAQWLASLRGADGKDGSPGTKGDQGIQGLKGDTGQKGDQGVKGETGSPGKDGAAQRIERYAGNVIGTAGVATVTWTTAFKAPPLGKVIDGWSGNQQITGRVTATTTTSATVAVRRSKATLLLSDGPYEVAPAGTSVEIEVTGF